MKKFWIRADGDDAPVIAEFDTYAAAEEAAKERSLDTKREWLGIALFGPSGRVAAFKGGSCVGYLDATSRRWVRS